MIQLAICIILVWLLFVILIKREKTNVKNNSTNKNSGQKIIACSVCNTHIEELDISKKDGKFYCKDCL